MNNIHEDDWADDSWSRHSGMNAGYRKKEKEPEATNKKSNKKESDKKQNS